MTWLLLAALVVIAAGGLADLLPVVRRHLPWLTYATAAAGSAGLAVLGATGVAGRPTVVSVDDLLDPTALRVDRLAGLFLLISFAVATPVCLVLASWARLPGRTPRRGLGVATALTLGACAVIVTADTSFAFVFGWETLTFGFYLLSGYHRHRPEVPRDSLVTLVFGKASGQFVLVGFLVLYAMTGSFALTGVHLPGGAARSVAYVLLLAGFAVKVGLAPGNIWMPAGYSAAPGPVRALMSGVAVNVGFYGMWRVLGMFGAPPGWLPPVLLLLGGFTAILGISHAAVQTRLSKVIGYSSVENAGLITVGYAVALVGAGRQDGRMVAVGLLAATLQMTTHAIAKALLFTSTGSIETACGSDELERLRGVARRMPFSSGGLVVGALTLAGLPPTIGFVSEWFLLEALMQQFRVAGLADRLALATAGALVALTVGFASVTFVRIVGLTVFGPRRETPVARPRELGVVGRIGLIVLATGCLGIAALSPGEVRIISGGLRSLVPAATTGGALKSPWVLQPVYADFSILSPSWLWIALPALSGAVLVAALLITRGSLLRVRRVPAWRSATEGVAGEDQYTPFGYAHPTRKVLANLLMTRNTLTRLERTSGGRTDDRRRGPAAAHLGYTTDVVEIVETYLYRPLRRPILAAARYARRLQSGRLDAYLAYMLIALIAVLAVVTAMA